MTACFALLWNLDGTEQSRADEEGKEDVEVASGSVCDTRGPILYMGPTRPDGGRRGEEMRDERRRGDEEMRRRDERR
jgi:hypothetical protein